MLIINAERIVPVVVFAGNCPDIQTVGAGFTIDTRTLGSLNANSVLLEGRVRNFRIPGSDSDVLRTSVKDIGGSSPYFGGIASKVASKSDMATFRKMVRDMVKAIKFYNHGTASGLSAYSLNRIIKIIYSAPTKQSALSFISYLQRCLRNDYGTDFFYRLEAIVHERFVS
jgi:hypothetical protein